MKKFLWKNRDIILVIAFMAGLVAFSLFLPDLVHRYLTGGSAP